MQNFANVGLSELLVKSLERMKFTIPTPIQAQAIPPALEGRDVLGSAQTGTGKTAAFAIPLIEKLLKDKNSTALVLTPTRELAVQVIDTMHQLLGITSKSQGSNDSIKTALLIGGEAISNQLRQLRCRPRLIVGTPGRTNDHLQRKTLSLSNTEFLVLDETDRMLDMGFSIQIDEILKYLKGNKPQTLMFSATFPPNITKLAEKYLNDPIRVTVGSTTQAAPKIKQEVINVDDSKKYDQLLEQLEVRTGSVIIFVKTKRGADQLAGMLERENHSVDAIHGDLRQNKRDKTIDRFRNQKFRIMVATDVAARGLDIPHIEHVINYDLPQCPEDYIHRIGRTARAGAEGSALCFVGQADRGKWCAIDRLTNPENYKNDRPERSGSSYGSNRGGRGNSRGGSGFSRGGRESGGYQGRRENSFAKDEDRPARNSSFAEEGGAPTRSFDKPAFEDKPRSPFGFKKHHDNDRPGRSFGADKPAFGDFKPRRFNNDEKPSFRDKPAFGDKPRFSRDGDRPSFGSRPSFGDKPRFSRDGDKPAFGDRPRFNRDGDRPSFGDRPRFGGDREGGRPAFKRDGDRPSFGDKPRFSRDGDKPSFGSRPSFGDKPRFGGNREGGRPSFGDKPRFSRDGERPSFGDRPRFGGDREGGRPAFRRDGDKPSFGSRPSFGDKRGPRSFGDKPAFGDKDKSHADKPRRKPLNISTAEA